MSKDNSKTDDTGRDWNPKNLPARIKTDDGDGDDDDGLNLDVDLPVSLQSIAIALTTVFAVLLAVAILVFAPYLWKIAFIATIIGFVPGVTLFPWLTSPFGPGLWLLSEPFARIHLTISQFIRRAGVLVKRSSNEYEIGTYLPESGEALLSDGRVDVDEDRTSWALFGKRRFGVTSELGTDLYERFKATDSGSAVADGGDEVRVNLNAAHRYMEGSNEIEAISRTKEAAEAQFGGGEELGTLTMGILVGLMLLLGSFTAMLML